MDFSRARTAANEKTHKNNAPRWGLLAMPVGGGK
jgi:hypothetical protein